jgi:hypothetical protein
MADAKLTLVLSGHMLRPDSADMRPFWRGFIELQKRLPSGKPVHQIVAHSWNPELDSIAEFVYRPNIHKHERQQVFYAEFIYTIDPPDRFERGLDRPNSTWKNVSIQSVLGNVRSRARAVQMIDELPLSGGQVLITRWDLGQSGSSQVNRLVMDSSLSEEYVYLSYFSEIDEGYADMWIVSPWRIARKFGSIDGFVLDCLAGRNGYLQKFCQTGWPRSYIKTGIEKAISHNYVQLIIGFLSKFLGDSGAKSLKGNLLNRVKRRLLAPLTRFIERPTITAENSFIPKSNNIPRIFPDFMSLNIHALLKYFMLTEGIREKTRFLTSEDFELTEKSGQLINPQPTALLIWNSDEDEAEIRALLKFSVIPIAYVVQMGKNLRLWNKNQSNEWSVKTLSHTNGSSRDQLLFGLESVRKSGDGLTPILIMPSLSKYLSCQNWHYLNALLKYIAWSQLGYVGLFGSRAGRPSQDFPGLSYLKGPGAFSLEMAAGTVNGILPYLNRADPDLRDVCVRAERMMLEFQVLAEKEALF